MTTSKKPTDTIAGLKRELAQIKREAKEEGELRTRLGKLLADTANALHGGLLKDGWWSWHDLSELAERQRRALEAAMHALRSYQYDNTSTELAKEMADELDKILNERAQDTVRPKDRGQGSGFRDQEKPDRAGSEP